MPKIWEQMVQKFKDKGMPNEKAYAIATSVLQKRGVLKKGTHELAESPSQKKKEKKNGKVQRKKER